MQPFKQLVSRTVVLRERNIDTDQIIPARFLTTTERNGLGPRPAQMDAQGLRGYDSRPFCGVPPRARSSAG